MGENTMPNPSESYFSSSFAYAASATIVTLALSNFYLLKRWRQAAQQHQQPNSCKADARMKKSSDVIITDEDDGEELEDESVDTKGVSSIALDEAEDDDNPSDTSAQITPLKRFTSTAGSEVLTSEHPVDPEFLGTETSVQKKPMVKRSVYVQDTNDFLNTVAIPPKNIPAASSTSNDSATTAAAARSSSTATESWSRCSIITSVPDVSETGMSLRKWRPWFQRVCGSILRRLEGDNCAIFYQTDIRVEGQWVSKAQLVMNAANQEGVPLIWHKIVLVNNEMTTRGSTASFVHLLCFSRTHREDLHQITPDILPHRGVMLWKRAMGLRAAEFACKYLKKHCSHITETVVDPFCGSGAALAMANRYGFHTVGVDHCRKRCLQAAQIVFDVDFEQSGGFGGAEQNKTRQLEKKAEARARKAERKANQLTQKEQQELEKQRKLLQPPHPRAAAAGSSNGSTQ